MAFKSKVYNCNLNELTGTFNERMCQLRIRLFSNGNNNKKGEVLKTKQEHAHSALIRTSLSCLEVLKAVMGTGIQITQGFFFCL